jgi:hypothetical protein
MSATTKKRGPGRPPKAADGAPADVTVHVRFTKAEIADFDAHLVELRRASAFGATVTRTSLIRALVLKQIGREDDAGSPGREPTKPTSTAQKGGTRSASKPKTKK